MVLAMLNCQCIHLLPCLPCYMHAFKQVDFINVMLSGLVIFNSTKAELLSVVSFRTLYNPSIQWLDIFGSKYTS
jgi:hypothetical protein